MKAFKDYLMITLGTVLLTCGVYFFKIPNGFSTGGVSGIGTLLGNITPLSPAMWISTINLVCLIIGFAVLGRETGVKTVYCSLLFSGLTQAFEYIFPLSSPLTDQPLLELIYAMLLTSVGSAVIFHQAASSGGTDIVALILKKFTHLNVGKALLCVDFLIAVSSFIVFDIKVGLFSLLGLFAKAFIVDGVIESMDACKHFMIITEKPQEIAEFVIKSLKHDATFIKAEGAYTHNEKTAVHTVCRRFEAVQLQRKIREIDPSAFMIISTSSEIIGRGFRGV
ncbi:MAG: YitT family protein [Acutalibacteraceae bacterium]